MRKNKKKDDTLRRLSQYVRPIWKWLVVACVICMVSIGCSLSAPGILGDLIQVLYDYWESGCQGSIRQLLIPGLALLAVLYCGQGLFEYLDMRLMNTVVSRRFSCTLRILISDKIQRLPVRYVDQTPVGDILNRMMDDVSTMSGYAHQIIDMLMKGVLQLLALTVLMLLEDWRLGVFVVAMMPLSVLLSSKIAALSEKSFDEMFELSGKRTEIVEESFSNFATAKAYNLERFTAARHDEISQKQRKAAVRATFISSMVQPMIAFTNALAYILINLLGGWLIVRQGASVGSVVTIVLYARQFAGPLEQIAYGFGQMERLKASARRVFAILDEPEEEVSSKRLPGTVHGEVRFENVDFSYDPKRPLIQNLNLRVEPGQKVAIVGPTGAGKTTIVNLLMRFYDRNAGKIFLDGMDINTVAREDVRSRFGMVLQDTWIFRGTVAENVAYGKPGAAREEIEEACRKAYCDHFIRMMPEGYDTIIGEDTANISGGQKQLLTIARALLADRPLLILDEATSNVDTRTEVLIQKAMDQLMKGRTCFVVAHRLSTIVDSDLILVLNDGRIVEQGKHTQLLDRKGFYYELYTSQYAR